MGSAELKVSLVSCRVASTKSRRPCTWAPLLAVRTGRFALDQGARFLPAADRSRVSGAIGVRSAIGRQAIIVSGAGVAFRTAQWPSPGEQRSYNGAARCGDAS
jgi:hypothetical protein